MATLAPPVVCAARTARFRPLSIVCRKPAETRWAGKGCRSDTAHPSTDPGRTGDPSGFCLCPGAPVRHPPLHALSREESVGWGRFSADLPPPLGSVSRKEKRGIFWFLQSTKLIHCPTDKLIFARRNSMKLAGLSFSRGSRCTQATTND